MMFNALIAAGIIWLVGAIVACYQQSARSEDCNFFVIVFWPIAAISRICRDFEKWDKN